MEFRQLHYFLEVAKQRNMTKAAENLHLSQPALSKMLKGLEEELGMALIVRTNKSSELTDAGFIVMEYAQKMIALQNEMSTTLSDMTNLQRGSIHLGIPPIAGSLFFPKALAQFHHEYPNITIEITEYAAPRLTKKVLDGEIELGIAVLPIDENLFDIQPILSEEIKLLVHNNHSLTHHDTINLKNLKEEECIFFNDDFALHEIMRRQCIHSGFEPNILFTSSQWDFMVEMVSANLGITFLPESLCQRIDNKQVKVLDFKPTALWNLAVITKKNTYVSNAARTFIHFMFSQKK